MRFTLARWITAEEARELDTLMDRNSSAMARDLDGAPVFMAPSAYGLTYEEDRYPATRFTDIKMYQARDRAGEVFPRQRGRSIPTG